MGIPRSSWAFATKTRRPQGYKDAVTGFSKNNPDYPFITWDLNRVITIPVRNITAPNFFRSIVTFSGGGRPESAWSSQEFATGFFE